MNVPRTMSPAGSAEAGVPRARAAFDEELDALRLQVEVMAIPPAWPTK
jgi:hypothetical protein